MVKYALAVGIAVGSSALSPLGAQIEASFGVGAYTSRLTDGGAPFSFVHFPTTYTSYVTSLGVAYRPNERWGIRTRLDLSRRLLSSGVFEIFGEDLLSDPYASSLGVHAEAAYYPNQWWSVGAGAGYNFLTVQAAFAGGTIFGTPEAQARTRALGSDIGLQDHAQVHLAFEAYAGILTFRVAPAISVGALRGGRSGLLVNGEPLAPRGSWLGLNTSVLIRAPFGKTEYAPAIAFDSLLTRAVAPVQRVLPRWSAGLSAETSFGVLNVGDEAGGYEQQPTRLRAGLQVTYRLDDVWRLRASMAWNRFRSYSLLDSVALETRAELETTFQGIDLMLGVERPVWKDFHLALDIGAVNTFDVSTSLADGRPFGTGTFPSRGDLPVADLIWMGDIRAFWQADTRLRLGGHVQYTLSNPNGDGPNRYLTPARSQDDRWLSVGVHAGWMLLK